MKPKTIIPSYYGQINNIKSSQMSLNTPKNTKVNMFMTTNNIVN